MQIKMSLIVISSMNGSYCEGKVYTDEKDSLQFCVLFIKIQLKIC